MGYIKEPTGVDFSIGEIPYTVEDAAITSAYLQAKKANAAKKGSQKKPLAARKRVVKRAA